MGPLVALVGWLIVVISILALVVLTVALANYDSVKELVEDIFSTIDMIKERGKNKKARKGKKKEGDA